MSFNLKPLCAAAALAAALMPLPAAAGKLMFLSTWEVPQLHPGGEEINTNAYNVFQEAAGGAANMVDKRAVLTNGVLTAADFDDVDTVVVQSVYRTITPANMAFLQNLMDTRPDITFIHFIDGCCQTTTNITPYINYFSGQTGWGLTRTGSGGSITSPLNSNSPYATVFPTSLVCEAYDLINNIPAGYAMYLGNGATPPTSLTAATSSYGFILPQKRSNSGGGACSIFWADTSLFGGGRLAQSRQVAAASLAAARNANGACKGATIEPDLTPVMTGPSHLQQGVEQVYGVTVKNVGRSDMAVAPAGTVRVELPAGMNIVPGSFPATCAWASPYLTCTGLPAIAANGSAPTIQFRAKTTTLTTATFKSVVGGTLPGEINRANNSAGVAPTGAPAANLTVGPYVPVPGPQGLALAGLAALVGWLGARRQRRHA